MNAFESRIGRASDIAGNRDPSFLVDSGSGKATAANPCGCAEDRSDGSMPGTNRSGAMDFWWTRVRREAEAMARAEPAVASLVVTNILGQPSLEAALVQRLASRLAGPVSADLLRIVFTEVMEADAELRKAWRLDLVALIDRDPAAGSPLSAILNFKGFHAVEAHRIAHALWNAGRIDLALVVADRVSEVLQVDIHPKVRIGTGVFIDHATGVSIGDTAEIGDNVSLLQGVVLAADPELGGAGRRHARVGSGVMIGAGAKLLGAIDIGSCSRIGAGSVVTRSVPPNTTVAGVPARVIGPAGCAEPSRTMDQMVFDVGL